MRRAVDKQSKKRSVDGLAGLLAAIDCRTVVDQIVRGDLIQKIGQNKIDYTVGSALDIFGGKLKYSDVLKSSL